MVLRTALPQPMANFSRETVGPLACLPSCCVSCRCSDTQACTVIVKAQQQYVSSWSSSGNGSAPSRSFVVHLALPLEKYTGEICCSKFCEICCSKLCYCCTCTCCQIQVVCDNILIISTEKGLPIAPTP